MSAHHGFVAPALLLLAAVACGPASVPSGGGPATDQPRSGGTLRALQREDPATLSIHEENTSSTPWPLYSSYNNLVVFDPGKAPESLETVVPDLAEKWSTAADGKSVTFNLRQGVKWHDGTPFTSKDVKYTFDTLKTGTDSLRPDVKMRANPRGTGWYANVEGIDTPDAQTVVFRLKKAQPSLLGMFATNYTPVYPSHVPIADLRTLEMGTGPFKLTEWKKGESLSFTRNADYFMPGRPYMDGLNFVIITNPGTQVAAIRTHQLQITHPGEFTKENAEELKAALPQLGVEEIIGTGSDNIVMNTSKEPWNNIKVRLAVAEAIDKEGYTAVRARGVVPGTTINPRGPYAHTPEELAKLPGFGPNIEQRRVKAKQLLAEAGFPNGFTTEVITRNIRLFTDLAPYTLDQLDRIGIKATLKILETPVYNTTLAQGDFGIASGSTALGFDDPDVMFFENLKCNELRNYAKWCNPEVDRLAELQSTTTDPTERKRLIQQMDRTHAEEASRPWLGWRMHYEIWWPEVHGFKAFTSVYDNPRLDNVWLSQ